MLPMDKHETLKNISRDRQVAKEHNKAEGSSEGGRPLNLDDAEKMNHQHKSNLFDAPQD